VNPWETSTVNGLIHKIKPQLVKYDVRLMENHDILHDLTYIGRLVH